MDAWLRAMRSGDWAAAWRQNRLCELMWDGTPFDDGCSVLVRCEHGLGDGLRFVRLVPSIAAIARAK